VAIDERSRAVLRTLVGRIDLDECVDRVRHALEQMPEYQGFVEGQADLDDRGPAAIRWNLEVFLRWATDGGEPTAAELEPLRAMIGARAAEGRPAEEGLAVYRRAMRAAWEAVLESADADERAALGEAFDVLLEWLDVLSAVFEQAYAEEREPLVSHAERRARRLFERTVAGEQPGPDDERLADALGLALDGPRRPLVAALAGGTAAEHLQIAALLRDQGALAISEGRRVAALADRPVDGGALGFAGRLALCELGPATRAPTEGAPPDGVAAGADDQAGGLRLANATRQPPDDLAEALDDLRAVVGLALAAGERGRIDLGAHLPRLLLARSPRLAGRLRRRVFGPLAEAGRDDLAETLALLAANGFERSATAAALPVHRNTLAQRIERIERLTGLDLDGPDDRGLVWLAAQARAVGSPHD
jgi:hypothetical protein